VPADAQASGGQTTHPVTSAVAIVARRDRPLRRRRRDLAGTCGGAGLPTILTSQSANMAVSHPESLTSTARKQNRIYRSGKKAFPRRRARTNLLFIAWIEGKQQATAAGLPHLGVPAAIKIFGRQPP
jgi:hypothetical protein